MKEEMDIFLKWFNDSSPIDPVLKSAIAHFWFVIIHPFEMPLHIEEMPVSMSKYLAKNYFIKVGFFTVYYEDLPSHLHCKLLYNPYSIKLILPMHFSYQKHNR